MRKRNKVERVRKGNDVEGLRGRGMMWKGARNRNDVEGLGRGMMGKSEEKE